MKKKFVNQLNPGETVDDVFLLSEKSISRKKDGDQYLNIALSDKTGRLNGVIWDNVDRINAEVTSGDFVNVQGSVGEYRESLQIVVKSIKPVSPDLISTEDFIPSTKRNTQQMFDRLKKITESIETPHLHELMARFWEDEEFVRRFKLAPAAKKMHHAYLGGLLEHTLSLVMLVEKIADHYVGIDKDLLLTGAILHDIGKIYEFEYERQIDYSDEGRLISHIVIGVELVDKKINQIKDFPQKDALLLKHLIVSHHGSRELGSPQPPMTLEAVLLNYLDEIDSKINGIREFIESHDTGEDWSPYHRLLERFFYKGK